MSKKPSFLEELPLAGSPNKTILCVHGLNQNPEALKPLLSDLSSQGFKVFLHHLPEHGENLTKATYDNVMNSYKDSHRYIEDSFGSADYYLGYSYGGLIGPYLLDHHNYEKMILLAPALQVKTYTHFIKLALPFLSRVTSMPLWNKEYEKHYRFHQKGVPRSVYTSFFDVYQAFHELKPERIRKSQALVFCNPKDELIHFKKLQEWVEQETSWGFHSLSNQKADFKRYNHLCFDQTTLGEQAYKKLFEQMVQFLSS